MQKLKKLKMGINFDYIKPHFFMASTKLKSIKSKDQLNPWNN